MNKFKNRNSLILLAEDNVINAEIGKEIIELFDLQVTIASDGYEVLQNTELKKFSIIFMDINMPGLDGIQTTDLIRNDEKNINRTTPIIALTAHIDEIIKEECINVGMNDIMKKPLKRNNIQNLIDVWINNTDIIKDDSPQKTIIEVPINLEEALYEFNNNKKLLDTVIKKFIELTEIQLEEIAKFQKQKDYESIQFNVHKIRGGAANLCIDSLSELAGITEEGCKEDNFEFINNSLLNLVEGFSRLKKYLEMVNK